MAREDHHATASRAIRQAIASALYPDQLVWREEDLAWALRPRSFETQCAVEAITAIVDLACDEAVGEVISSIRKAEGIGAAALDAALGVEPEDDDLEEPVRYDADGNALPTDQDFGTD